MTLQSLLMVIISSYFLVAHGMVLQALGQRCHSRFKILFIRQRRKALSFFVRISVCMASKPWCPLVVVICVVWQIVGHRGSTEIPLVPAIHNFIDSVPLFRAPRFAGKSRMQSWDSSAKGLSSRLPVPLQATPKGLLHLFVLWATRCISLYFPKNLSSNLQVSK